MNHSPPRVIADYFAAANDGRVDDAAACFADDALVHDESRDHKGRPMIRGWIEDTTRRYQPRTEILRVEERDGTFLVAAKVSGTFPGSPLELEYTFAVRAEKISRLSIG